MEERLRFTGENPPASLWDRFPNWQNAYEEEGLPGQDETTLRPADNQQTIDDDVTFTVGNAILAGGETVATLLGILSGKLDYVCVYPNSRSDTCWVLRFDEPSQQWLAMNDDWFLQSSERLLPAPIADQKVFPMRVMSRLPLQRSGQTIVVDIPTPVG